MMDYTTGLLFVLLTECIAVNIKRLHVPQVVALGTESVVLDCDYSLGTDTTGLVVKWFFNSKNNPIYQWIPPLKPQDLGLLKGKVDLDFRIADEKLKAHRAIKLLQPTTQMSGNYTCVVSTFEAEDRKSNTMLIYSPGKNLRFFQEKKYVFLVTLVCCAEDLYPKPVMTISSKSGLLSDVKTDVEMDSWGLYDIVTSAVVHDDDIFGGLEVFECELRLPQAGYIANRTTVYYPGLMPTAQLAAIETAQKSQDKQFSSSAAWQKINCNLIYCSLILIVMGVLTFLQKS